jgi:hypothetical protein
MKVAPGSPKNLGGFESRFFDQVICQAVMPFTSSNFYSRKTRWVLRTTQFCTPLRLPLKPERSGIRCGGQQAPKLCEPVY